MPLQVQHLRAGEAVPYRWGLWHLDVFRHVADHHCNPDGTVLTAHSYQDPADGEVVTVEPGDVVLITR